ncbi:YaaL family protein [Salimicrobium sp. PL1-032A]|uniref:YaaL family protein n=1 Tax=Salimicrobium sp. PL1-032A TaxID=3095364 RepID=UPI0032618154
MFNKKKRKRREEKYLVESIRQAHQEWEKLENVMSRSIDPSEESYMELSVAKAKYFYLLREARIRGVHALS